MTSRAPGERRIDLNADVGEGYEDEQILPFVTSASIACGAHAGDLVTMRATLRLARRYDVAVGAHPSFPDRAGFGRRITTRDPARIAELVAEQIALLAGIAADEGLTVKHVKPHGALYNLSAVDEDVAAAIARTVARVAPGAQLFGLAGSRSLPAARAAGLDAVAEGFVDRAYLNDGTLAPRERAGAVVTDPHEAARRAVQLVLQGTVETLDGAPIALHTDTLCLHGDATGAAGRARIVRDALRAAGVAIVARG